MGDAIAVLGLISQETISNIPQKEFLLIELGIIIIMAAIFAMIARFIKQPPILAYVIAGFIVGPAVFGFVKDIQIISSLSEIGIAFLLFLAGLELSFKKLKQVNLKKISLVGTFQVLLVFIFTLLLVKYISLGTMQGVYLGIILAFSSTMVVVKILSDKQELVTMHGRLILGILLLQDLFAILALALLTSKTFSFSLLAFALVKLLLLVGVAFILQKLVFSWVFKHAASSHHAKELLLLSSLAAMFLFILGSLALSLSIAIGAFIAGVSLANLPFKLELESRIGPLRDFFSILFFVALGMQIVLTGIQTQWKLFLFLVIGAFILKPAITFLLIRISGYRQRTSFITSLSLAQLSEFSIILAVLGFTVGVFDQPMLSIIVLATIFTMSLTIFFMDSQEKIYNFFKRPLALFKFIPISENVGYYDKEKKSILLVGCDRMGSIILRELIKDNKKDVLVLDYNPEIVATLKRKKISCMYGDVKSPDFLEHINVATLKKVISTVPDLDDGLILLEKIKKQNKNIQVILTAGKIDDALELYEKDADYVMVPRFTAGEVVSNILNKDADSLDKVKKGQIDRIKSANNILK